MKQKLKERADWVLNIDLEKVLQLDDLPAYFDEMKDVIREQQDRIEELETQLKLTQESLASSTETGCVLARRLKIAQEKMQELAEVLR